MFTAQILFSAMSVLAANNAADVWQHQDFLTEHESRVNHIAVHAGGLMASGDSHGRIIFWKDRKPHNSFELPGKIVSLAFTKDGKALLAGTSANTIHLLPISGQAKKVFTGHTDWVVDLQVLSDNQFLSASYDGTLRSWNLQTGKGTVLAKDLGKLGAMDLCPKADVIAVVSSGSVKAGETKLTLLDLSGKELKTHPHCSTDVVFSEDGNTLVSVGPKGIRLYSVSYVQTNGIRRPKLQSERSIASLPVTSLAISSDNVWLAAGMLNSRIAIYRLENIQPPPEMLLTMHKHTVTSVGFTPNDRKLISASVDSRLGIAHRRKNSRVVDAAAVERFLKKTFRNFRSHFGFVRRLRKRLNVKEVEQLVGIRPFLAEQPHGSFRHYNPKFIRRLLKALPLDPVGPLYEVTQSLYKPRFRNFHTRLVETYLVVSSDPQLWKKCETSYKALVAKGKGQHFSPRVERSRHPNQEISPQLLSWWFRRHLDGTEHLLIRLALRAMKLYDPGNYDYYRSRYNLRGLIASPKNPQTLYFNNHTFIDDFVLGLTPSPLSCRELLIRTFDITEQKDPPKQKKPDGQPELSQFLFNSPLCREFDKKLTYRQLSPDKDKAGARFRPVDWDRARIEFKHDLQGCGGSEDDVKVELRPFGSADPLLVVGSSNPSMFAAKRPYSELKAPPEPDIKKEDTPKTTTVALRGRMHSNIKGVYLKTIYIPFYGLGTQGQTVKSEQNLIIQLKDGGWRKLFSSKGYGCYSYSNANISDIVMTDVNNDGDADFIFTIDNGGRVLLLTRNGYVLEKHVLKMPSDPAVGGC